MVRLALVCTPLSDANLRLAKQISCEDIVFYNMDEMPPTVDALLEVKRQVESHGLRLSVVEGGPPMDKIVANLPGKEEQLEAYKECIRNMGKAGIPVLCYNFMHWGCRVGRTSYSVPIRGGALSSQFDLAKWDDTPNPDYPPTNHEDTWKQFEWFIKEVTPVAREANVFLAIHPDDPPLPKLRGFARIFNTLEAFDRLASIEPDVHNGITYDISLFGLMGADTPEALRRFKDRIHFVHFRDVVGVPGNYTELFHDEGQVDHVAAMRTLHEIGFDGPLRPDHVPLMEGEEGHDTGFKAKGYFSGKASGYTMQGRLYACGYLRGLIQAVTHK